MLRPAANLQHTLFLLPFLNYTQNLSCSLISYLRWMCANVFIQTPLQQFLCCCCFHCCCSILPPSPVSDLLPTVVYSFQCFAFVSLYFTVCFCNCSKFTAFLLRLLHFAFCIRLALVQYVALFLLHIYLVMRWKWQPKHFCVAVAILSLWFY